MENSNHQTIEVVKVKADKNLDPHEVILNNANVLIHATPENRIDLLEKQLGLLLQQLQALKTAEDKDIAKNMPQLMTWAVSLSSIQLAIEYWMGALKRQRIQVYSPKDMPKK